MKYSTNRATWPNYSREAIEKVSRLLGCGQSYFGGKSDEIFQVEEFFSNRTRKQAIMVGSGTAALHTAYKACDLKENDSVLLPTNSFRATFTPALHFTKDLRFYGYSEEFKISLKQISSMIDDTTKVLVVSHMWGIPQDFSELIHMCQSKGIIIIEDCSQAHASSLNDVLVGSLSDICVMSLGTKKIISGGNGGIISLRDASMFNHALEFSQPWARVSKTLNTTFQDESFRGSGVNYRASPISACLCLDHINRLDELLEIRAKSVASFIEKASNTSHNITFPGEQKSVLSERNFAYYSLPFSLKDSGHSVNGVVAKKIRDIGHLMYNRPNIANKLGDSEKILNDYFVVDSRYLMLNGDEIFQGVFDV